MTNYKCIVTLRSGAHKLVRVTRDVMAHIVTEYRKMQRSIWRDRSVLEVNGTTLTLNDIAKMVFVNEWTGEKLEIA